MDDVTMRILSLSLAVFFIGIHQSAKGFNFGSNEGHRDYYRPGMTLKADPLMQGDVKLQSFYNWYFRGNVSGSTRTYSSKNIYDTGSYRQPQIGTSKTLGLMTSGSNLSNESFPKPLQLAVWQPTGQQLTLVSGQSDIQPSQQLAQVSYQSMTQSSSQVVQPSGEQPSQVSQPNSQQLAQANSETKSQQLTQVNNQWSDSHPSSPQLAQAVTFVKPSSQQSVIVNSQPNSPVLAQVSFQSVAQSSQAQVIGDQPVQASYQSVQASGQQLAQTGSQFAAQTSGLSLVKPQRGRFTQMGSKLFSGTRLVQNPGLGFFFKPGKPSNVSVKPAQLGLPVLALSTGEQLGQSSYQSMAETSNQHVAQTSGVQPLQASYQSAAQSSSQQLPQMSYQLMFQSNSQQPGQASSLSMAQASSPQLSQAVFQSMAQPSAQQPAQASSFSVAQPSAPPTTQDSSLSVTQPSSQQPTKAPFQLVVQASAQHPAKVVHLSLVRPVSQQLAQPVFQSVSQSGNQQPAQASYLSLARPFFQQPAQPVFQSVSQSGNQHLSLARPGIQQPAQATFQSAAQSSSQQAAQPIYHSVSQPSGQQPADKPGGLPITQPTGHQPAKASLQSVVQPQGGELYQIGSKLFSYESSSQPSLDQLGFQPGQSRSQPPSRIGSPSVSQVGYEQGAQFGYQAPVQSKPGQSKYGSAWLPSHQLSARPLQSMFMPKPPQPKFEPLAQQKQPSYLPVTMPGQPSYGSALQSTNQTARKQPNYLMLAKPGQDAYHSSSKFVQLNFRPPFRMGLGYWPPMLPSHQPELRPSFPPKPLQAQSSYSSVSQSALSGSSFLLVPGQLSPQFKSRFSSQSLEKPSDPIPSGYESGSTLVQPGFIYPTPMDYQIDAHDSVQNVPRPALGKPHSRNRFRLLQQVKS